tara:strand:+ start:559 stop:885 length:327 start_codon:yes stop_codon:yes gene_type:complete
MKKRTKQSKKLNNKTKRNDVPEIPFTYDFYLVYWKDIESDAGWKDMKEIEAMKPATCVSTGWLIKKNRDVHILMSDYNYNKYGELGDGGTSTVIPTANILTMFKIDGL